MQWDDSVNAGFNLGTKPWIKVNPNYKEINVKKQLGDSDSLLNFYKKLLKYVKILLIKILLFMAILLTMKQTTTMCLFMKDV